jgi:CRP-like cAMP-binding protein
MRLAALAELRAHGGNAALARELRRVPLFGDLPQGDALAVFDALSEVEAGAGTVVCRRGEPGDCAYIVEEGAVEARIGLGPDGVTLRRLGPGDVFGEMSLLTGEPRSADNVVVADAVLWVLDRADFQALIARSVPLLRALTRTLAERMAQNAERLEGRAEPPGEGDDGALPPGAAAGAGAAAAPGTRPPLPATRPSPRGRASAFAPLTPREREVAALIAQGLTNREIAAVLVVTERTAATHVEHILSKLGLRSRAQVAAWTAEQGLLEGG